MDDLSVEIDGPQVDVGPEPFFRAVFDALSDPTAVIGRDGTLVEANAAWKRFGARNGGAPGAGGVGSNYLDVCARSTAAGCLDAARARDGLTAVLTGAVPLFEMEYACDGPDGPRWFLQRVTPLPGFDAAVTVHVDITWRREAEEHMTFLARHDPLTGLLNRSSLEDTLRGVISAAAAGASTAVLFVDMDRLKEANDEFGHGVGDAILAEAGRRLHAAVRAEDHVVRAGGDEFVVVLSAIAEPGGGGAVAARVESTLAEPYRVGSVVARLGASVGMAVPERGDSPATLMARADGAMYSAKRRRRADRR